jgi:FkbM family methyltransferase
MDATQQGPLPALAALTAAAGARAADPRPSDPASPGFLAAYAIFLADCAGADHRDNYDWRRFGRVDAPHPTPGQRLGAAFKKQVRGAGLVRLADVKTLLHFGLRFAAPHIDNLQWLYERLADEPSRDLLARIIAYRAVGHRHVKLPLDQPAHWRAVEELERTAARAETVDAGFLGWRLPKLDLRPLGYPIELFGRADGAVIQFVHEQYRCLTPQGAIEARDGDTVIDAGGCWGDSALYFAHRVGRGGRVYSFEFLPNNLDVFRRNLALNPQLAPRIEVVPHPVWSTGDVELFVSGAGPGARVGPTRQTPADATVRTLSIDQLAEREALPRVDFVKMDIEGAEQAALRGAEGVLRRWRPRLAVTVYHSLADFWEIPRYIDGLGLGYRFYLRHFTIHAEETVLFAMCDEPASLARNGPA